ncbi:hypothetical protein TorRG33x02_176930 [Trema orientale]|uniref:Uncharacterized protein n=1 Tax=Trema orientale TaxID=63057 RepID=A0A2P5ELY4_TREOI|nr:hypothetical protein TorRG33x02_176930 [Trema orientale]
MYFRTTYTLKNHPAVVHELLQHNRRLELVEAIAIKDEHYLVRLGATISHKQLRDDRKLEPGLPRRTIEQSLLSARQIPIPKRTSRIFAVATEPKPARTGSAKPQSPNSVNGSSSRSPLSKAVNGVSTLFTFDPTLAGLSPYEDGPEERIKVSGL